MFKYRSGKCTFSFLVIISFSMLLSACSNTEMASNEEQDSKKGNKENVAKADAGGGVKVSKGPTPIPGGAAQKEGDITLRNDRLAVSIAAESPSPYGVPSGSLVDAAPIEGGKIAIDKDPLTQVELIPNRWSAWPNTFSETQIVEDSADRGSVKVRRDWGEVIMSTTYTLDRGSDQVHMVTEMHNKGKEPKKDIYSGYVLWEQSGNLLGIPGLDGEEGTKEGALASWNALYDKEWALSVHVPEYTHFGYEGRDLYKKHTLEPGEKTSIEGWFQVVPSGDTSEILQAEAERKDLPTGTVTGEVTTEQGEIVEEPVVVAYKNQKPYAWAIGDEGSYELTLPEGGYEIYANAEKHAPSVKREIDVAGEKRVSKNLSGLRPPGEMELEVSDQNGPIDARISVAEGYTPTVGFLGRSTFFTKADTEDKGKASFSLAPGDYKFDVTSGEGFVSNAKTTAQIPVKSDEKTSDSVMVKTQATPNEKGWYSADLHHHSLGLEGVSPPEYVFRSQMAARLDLAFLSDHDTMQYLPEMNKLAEQRGCRLSRP